jgi:quercetin dioxygenase-like cupin family protein
MVSLRHLRSRALTVGLGAFLAAAVLAGCGSDGPTASGTGDTSGASTAPTAPTAPAAEAVVKEVLAEDTTPPGAPGYTLTLMRYTIAPGAQLAPHVHPGVQMAEVESGTLTYTIVSGTAQVRRGAGGAQPVTGPTTIQLAPGDSVVEPFDMVHYGANDTGEPVVLTATLLTESALGLSVAVSTTTTVTAVAP